MNTNPPNAKRICLSRRVEISADFTATIKQAVSLNNEGARLVRQCHYDSAVESFKSILKMLRPLAVIVDEHNHAHRSSHEGDGTNDTTTDANSDAYSSSSSRSVLFSISFDNKSMDTDTYDSNDNTTTMTTTVTQVHPSSLSGTSSPHIASTNTFASHKPKPFVFRDPVVILPESVQSVGASTNISDIEDESLSVHTLQLIHKIWGKLLSIVMYNFALTLHLHALSMLSSSSSSSASCYLPPTQTVNKCKYLFSKSRKLYESAFEMHLQVKSHDIDVDQLFTLTILNNLGLICRTVNDTSNSTRCFRSIFSLMMCILVIGGNESLQSIKGWDRLLSNAISFQHTYEITAAAA